LEVKPTSDKIFFIDNHPAPLYILLVAPLNKNKYADVVLIQPPYMRLTYGIPEKFQDDLGLGHQVLVPLGRRKATAVVIQLAKDVKRTDIREIDDILDPEPLVPEELLRLTRWTAEYYLASWGEAIRAALPPSVQRNYTLTVRFKKFTVDEKTDLNDFQKSILNSLEGKKSLTLSTLEKRLGKNLRYTLGKLSKLGFVEIEQVFAQSESSIKKEKWVELIRQPSQEVLESLHKKAPRQARVILHLTEKTGSIPRSELDIPFPVLKRLEEQDWIAISEKEVIRDMYHAMDIQPPENFTLTSEQKLALTHIQKNITHNHFHVSLLHGITGSGKTQVYIDTIRSALDQNKSALVLIPEISLTPQAIYRYRQHFGDVVAVLHSRMSAGERYDAWRKIRSGHFRIALGPRSAVFAPLQNLGLIVVDEEHDASYKQNDPAPRYHARDVAVVRGQLNGCPVILGSATPSLESYANAENKKYSLLNLPKRIDHIPLPRVTMVSMNEKDQAFILSHELQQKIQERLDKNEQIILLQNRRGYATFLRCSDCGDIEGCPNCNITLTFHQEDRRVRCHYCGFQKQAADACAVCGGASIRYRGVGTQRVEEALKEAFPSAKILRMDQDTMRRKNAHHQILTAFEKGEADILLGTQMIAKGHDFSRVNLVGIISADTGLHFPDFRSGERTFQLITQTAGRAGRRQEGEVVVQTRSLNNPVLQFAIKQDYLSYYQWEMQNRKELNYPPWGRIAIIRFKGNREGQVIQAARHFTNLLPRRNIFERLGPVPCPISKIKKLFRYQIILRVEKEQDPGGKQLRNHLQHAMSHFRKQVKFPHVRVAIDMDPVDTM